MEFLKTRFFVLAIFIFLIETTLSRFCYEVSIKISFLESEFPQRGFKEIPPSKIVYFGLVVRKLNVNRYQSWYRSHKKAKVKNTSMLLFSLKYRL